MHSYVSLLQWLPWRFVWGLKVFHSSCPIHQSRKFWIVPWYTFQRPCCWEMVAPSLIFLVSSRPVFLSYRRFLVILSRNSFSLQAVVVNLSNIPLLSLLHSTAASSPITHCWKHLSISLMMASSGESVSPTYSFVYTITFFFFHSHCASSPSSLSLMYYSFAYFFLRRLPHVLPSFTLTLLVQYVGPIWSQFHPHEATTFCTAFSNCCFR